MPDRRAGVLGRPIAHSLSPVLHRAAYAELGLDWTYEAIDCGVAELPAVLAARTDWAGFSATMPLKHAVLDVAAEVRAVAAAVGAANTLLPGPDGWVADNTDVAGIVAALAEHAVAPESVTLLGAGGTAQAALAALIALGVDDCTVLVRDAGRRGRVARHGAAARHRGDARRPRPGFGGAGRRARRLHAAPGVADRFAGRTWSNRQAVLDVVYSPGPTPLAQAAAGGGAKVVSGALMLLHQAAVQVALMTGEDAPLDAMRAALEAAVPNAGV